MKIFLILAIFLAPQLSAVKIVVLPLDYEDIDVTEVKLIEGVLSNLYMRLSSDASLTQDLALVPYPKLLKNEFVFLKPFSAPHDWERYMCLKRLPFPEKNNISKKSIILFRGLYSESYFAHNPNKWGGSWCVFTRYGFLGIIKISYNFKNEDQGDYVKKTFYYYYSPYSIGVMRMASELVLTYARNHLQEINEVEDEVIDGISESLHECEEALKKDTLLQFKFK